MVLSIDVHYKNDIAKAVGVLFEWEDTVPKNIVTVYLRVIEEYIPGEFYKRELPCLLKVLEQIDLSNIKVIIIDGYVFIDNERNLGLGGRLWEALNGRIPVIGVAKTAFLKNKETVREVKRGNSQKPLFISSIGVDLETSAFLIKQMRGNYRMPDILKILDSNTKEK